LPIGAAGFCWGGKHTAVLCHGERSANSKILIDAGFTAHPSRLAIPGDIEKVKLPLSIAHAGDDAVLSMDQIRQVEGIFKKLDGVSHEVVTYPGASHGFSVRADPTKVSEDKHADEAALQAINWFSQHFVK